MDKKKNADDAERHKPEAAVKCSKASSVENPQTSEDGVTVKCTGICSVEGQQDGQDQSLIVPVCVSSSEKSQVAVLTYALIDSHFHHRTVKKVTYGGWRRKSPVSVNYA